jgi:hypothetical protein
MVVINLWKRLKKKVNKIAERDQLLSEEYFEFGKKLSDWIIVGCGAALIIGLTYLVILIAKSYK